MSHRPQPRTSPNLSGAHAAAPVTTTPTSHAAAPSRFAKWGTIAALVLAILAVAGAAYGYFFPNESAAAAGKYTDQQRSDSKKHICETLRSSTALWSGIRT